MATKRGKKQTRARNNSKPEEYRPVRIIRVKGDEDIKTLYAKVRKAFTAADLARYCQDEPMIPAEQLVEELKAIEREERKRKKKRAAR